MLIKKFCKIFSKGVEKMKNLHEILKSARLEANLSQKQAAELSGVSQGAISMYEKDPNEVLKNSKGKSAVISFEVLSKLAKAYNKPLEYFTDQSRLSATLGETISIPKLNIFAGAGSEGVFDISLLKSDKSISVSREIIGKLNPINLNAIEIIGDSMEPEFYEGDIAVIDMVNHRYDFVKIAGIYIVRTQEAVYIKRVEFLPKGGVKLISINKNYTDIILNSDDDFEILGKVCGKIHFTKGLVFTTQGIN